MAVPSVDITLKEGGPPPQPADLSNVAHIVGPCSAGAVAAPADITTETDLRAFGEGPGVEMAAAALAAGANPLYLTRSATSTPGAAGTVTKTDPASAVGVSVPLYGEIRLAGADKDGNVLFQALQSGVSLTVVSGGSVSYAVVGKAITLQVTATTTGLLLEAQALGAAAGLIAQPVHLGTGASFCGQTLAATSFDKGSISVGPLVPGVRYKTVVAGGANAALDASASAKDVTITLGTDADGQIDPSKNTGLLVAAKVAAVPAVAALLSVGQIGDGSGLIGQQASFQALTFGSSAAASISGNANNRYDVVVRCVKPGALGTATIQWSADSGDDEKGGSWSTEALVPGGGVVPLRDSRLDTGLTLTLTGTLAQGDTWRFATSAPTSNATDLGTAMTAALNDRTRPFGWFGIATPVDSALAVAINTTLATAAQAPQYEWVYAICGSRDRDLAGGETAQAWRDAVNADFNGATPVQSAFGRVWICSGAGRRFSSYGQRYYRSNPVYGAVARRASRPVHEDLGKRRTGAVAGWLLLYHDEALNASFSNNRQITMYNRGGIYFTRTMTLADPSSRYSRGPVAAVMAQCATILNALGSNEILDTLVANPKTGAIADEEARPIEQVLEFGLKQFLFSPKKDGKISATPPSADQKMVTVLQNYNYLATNELRIEAAVIPVGYNDAVKIGLTLQIPMGV